MMCLSYLYKDGNGVPQDDAKAREWHEKAWRLYEKISDARGQALIRSGGRVDFR